MAKVSAPNQTILGRVPPSVLAAFVGAVGDGTSWPDNGRARQHRAQRNTTSLAFREDRIAYESRYERASAPGHEEIIDLPSRAAHPSIEPLLALVLATGVGEELGKAIAAWMAPRSHIGRHVDEGAYFGLYNRVHIPLVTNPEVLFVSEDETFHMAVGNLYLFQNTRPHAVMNKSRAARLHLIVDVR